MPNDDSFQLLLKIAEQFVDRETFLRECREAWAASHNVRKGRHDQKDLLFQELDAFLVKWKDRKPRPKRMPSQGEMTNHLKRTFSGNYADTTFRKYAKLYRLKMRPAGSFTLKEKRWLKKNDAFTWRWHEQVVKYLSDRRKAWDELRRSTPHSHTHPAVQLSNEKPSLSRHKKRKRLTREDILNSPDDPLPSQ